jgi:hypothetical protein
VGRGIFRHVSFYFTYFQRLIELKRRSQLVRRLDIPGLPLTFIETRVEPASGGSVLMYILFPFRLPSPVIATSRLTIILQHQPPSTTFPPAQPQTQHNYHFLSAPRPLSPHICIPPQPSPPAMYVWKICAHINPCLG